MSGNIDKRISELIDKGYGRWLSKKDNGIFYGMHVLEGEAYLRDGRVDEPFRKLNARILLGRDITVPSEINGIHAYDIGDVATLFHALFVDGFADLTGYNSVPAPFERMPDHFTNHYSRTLGAAVDNHFKLTASGLHVPLTLFYVHGDTTEDLDFRFAPENGERHPVNSVLREYREQFFNGLGDARPTILMATCNMNDSRQSASIENPGFHVVYRKGLAGGQLAATGKIEADF